MPNYEIYFLDAEHRFRDVEFLTEMDDKTAIAASRRLFTVRIHCAGFEVWEGERLLAFDVRRR